MSGKLSTLSLVQEKRQAPRMPVDWDVQMRLTGEDLPMQVRALNISKGGVAVSLERELSRDAVAKLVLYPDDGGGELHAYAYVAWSAVRSEHSSAGLRFMGIGEKDEARLAGLVENWILQRGRVRSRN
jgi:hypothetical protein